MSRPLFLASSKPAIKVPCAGQIQPMSSSPDADAAGGVGDAVTGTGGLAVPLAPPLVAPLVPPLADDAAAAAVAGATIGCVTGRVATPSVVDAAGGADAVAAPTGGITRRTCPTSMRS